MKIDGLVSIQETTSLLDKQYLLRAKNLMPHKDNIAVRNGATKRQDIAVLGLAGAIMPNQIHETILGGEKVAFILDKQGQIFVMYPDSVNELFVLYRRYYDKEEQIFLRTDSYVANKFEVFQIGSDIYILSDVKSWVVNSTGFIRLNRKTHGFDDNTCVVDAWDATIVDLDKSTLHAHSLADFASTISKDSQLYCRARNEFGGRGSATNPITISQRGSYVCAVDNKLKYKNQTGTSVEFPIQFFATVDTNFQNYFTDAEEATDTDTKLRVHKNIFSFGGVWKKKLPPVNSRYTIKVYIPESDMSKFVVGSTIGMTAGILGNDTGNNVWADVRVESVDVVTNINTIAINTVFPSSAVVTLSSDKDISSITEIEDLTIDYDLLGGSTNIDYEYNPEPNPIISVNDVILWETNDGHHYLTYGGVTVDDKGAPQANLSGTVALANFMEGGAVYAFGINKDNIPKALYFKDKETATAVLNGQYWLTAPLNTMVWYENNTIIPVFYAEGTESRYFNIATVHAKRIETKIGVLGGTRLDISSWSGETLNTVQTWFKDRPFNLRIPWFSQEVDETTVYALPRLVAFHEPHNISSQDTIKIYGTLPKLQDVPLPFKTNLWHIYKTSPAGSEVTFTYNPHAIVNENGDVIIHNTIPINKLTRSIPDALFVGVKVGEFTTTNFDNVAHEIYKVIPESIASEKIAEGLTWDTLIYSYAGKNISVPTGARFKQNFPVLLSNIDVFAEPAVLADRLNSSAGRWDSATYFNNSFWFSDKNVLKKTNMKLEWNQVNTFEFDGYINDIKALNKMLYVFTTVAVYTIDEQNNINRLMNMSVTKAVVVDDIMMVVDSEQRLYTIMFSPVPVQNQRELTYNPYIIKQEQTEDINSLREYWTIYDIVSIKNQVFVATDLGVFVYDKSRNSWWEQVYPVTFLKLFVIGERLYGIGGEYLNIVASITDKFQAFEFDDD